MKLTDMLYDAVQDIWEQYGTHPFITQLSTGQLPVEKFLFYMIQDYLYLYEYARVFALGVVKAKDHSLMRAFSSMVESTLNGEMKTHESYMHRLGITEDELNTTQISLINSSYTNYMLSVGQNGDVLDILIAILSCAWSYQEIGRQAAKVPGSIDHPLYGEWVACYSGMEYGQVVDETLELVNRYGQNLSPDRVRQLTDIFVRCSRYELWFWDMAYNMTL